jgi:hypothetical protein
VLPADVILLAIQAGVRLYGGFREAYVTSIKGAAITLPLPSAPDDFGISEWVDAIERSGDTPPNPTDKTTNGDYTIQHTAALELCKTFDGMHALTDLQQQVLKAFYANWLAPPPPPGTVVETDPTKASTDSVLAMLSVRQWAADQTGQHATAFQTAVGTIIDVAVYWFANDPGAIATNRPEGRALRGFLQSLDTVKIDFAHASTAAIASGIMVALLDTVSADPRLVAGGAREEALVKATTSALAGAIKNIPQGVLDGLNTRQSEALTSVVQTVMAATLRAASATVLNDPKLFYVGTPDSPETKVVEQVGQAFAAMVLPPEVGGLGKIDLASAVSSSGLEKMVRATLAAVGDNPALLHLDGATEKRLTPLLADLATSLSKAAIPSIDAALPEAVSIVLGATSRHIDTLWPNNSTDPTQNLARGAAVAALGAITADVGKGTGFSGFTTSDVTALINAVVASVIDNPGVMKLTIGGGPALNAALVAMLRSLKGQHVTALSGEDVVTILTAGLKAAAGNLPLLQQAQTTAPLLIDGVFQTVFAALATVQLNGGAPAWQAASRQFVIDVLKDTLGSVAALPVGSPVTTAKLTALQSAIVEFITAGQPLAALPGVIQQALGT